MLLLAMLAIGPALAAGESDFDRGVDAIRARDYPRAVRAFQAAVRKAPEDPHYHLWLGMARISAGDVGGGRAALQTASRLGGDSDVGRLARQRLSSLEPTRQAPVASSGSSGASAEPQTPTGWKPLPSVEGLIGDDWHVRNTRYCRAWARKGDLGHLEEVMRSLDHAYGINSRFMGFQARLPLEIYFFSMTDLPHTHPKFSKIKSRNYAGLALSGTNTCLVKLGTHGTHFPPWEVSRIMCHEINHLFLYQVDLRDSADSNWFAEALAETVEDRIQPPPPRRISR